jgi:hypothetical protein
MDWFKKHTDAVIILTAFAGCMLWMNGKFNDIDRRFYIVDAEILTVRNDMNQRFSEVEKEIAIIKAIMIIQKIMPAELAAKE